MLNQADIILLGELLDEFTDDSAIYKKYKDLYKDMKEYIVFHNKWKYILEQSDDEIYIQKIKMYQVVIKMACGKGGKKR